MLTLRTQIKELCQRERRMETRVQMTLQKQRRRRRRNIHLFPRREKAVTLSLAMPSRTVIKVTHGIGECMYLIFIDKICIFSRCDSLPRPRSNRSAKSPPIQGPHLPPHRPTQQVRVRHLLQDFCGQRPGWGQSPRERSTWVESRAILQNGIRKRQQR